MDWPLVFCLKRRSKSFAKANLSERTVNIIQFKNWGKRMTGKGTKMPSRWLGIDAWIVVRRRMRRPHVLLMPCCAGDDGRVSF